VRSSRDADEITGVVGDNLRNEKENALRNRRLNALVRDVELPLAPSDLGRRPIREADVRAVFRRLQFTALLDRVLKSGEVDSADADAAASSDIQRPPVRQLIDEELARWIESESASGTAALGLRVVPGPTGITAFGLASLTDSVKVPWASGRPDYTALERWLASEAPKQLTDAKQQARLLGDSGLAIDGLDVDTTLATWLASPTTKPPELAGQVSFFLGETLVEPDPNVLFTDAESLDPAIEAWYTRRIADEAEARLDEGSRWVLHEIELPLLPVLERMERVGIAVDRGIVADLISRLNAQATEVAQSAYAEIGREVNLGSPKQLQEVLFDQLAMPKTRSTKTGYSTDAAALTDLQDQHPHPFLGLLLQHRDVTKLGQISETLIQAIGSDGRIHTTYEQTQSATGRLASQNPNLQNIPIRTEVGRELRKAFVVGEGFETLLTADYSQIEMRIMAHLSGDDGLIEAFRSGEDLHRFVGSRIFGVAPDEVTPLMRTNGQGHVIRARVRSVGFRTGQAAAY